MRQYSVIVHFTNAFGFLGKTFKTTTLLRGQWKYILYNTKHWQVKILVDCGQFTKVLSAKYLNLFLTNEIISFYISCLGAVAKVLSTKIVSGLKVFSHQCCVVLNFVPFCTSRGLVSPLKVWGSLTSPQKFLTHSS